jgi:hypothetical protein
MKGKLYIKDNGLQFVQYHIINSIRSLPLHRDSVRLLSLRSDKQPEHMHMEEVDFEIVKEYTDSNTNQIQQYAKLTQCKGLNLESLESKLNHALKKETTESLSQWLNNKRADDNVFTYNDYWLIKEKYKETLEFGEWLLANEIDFIDNTIEGNIYKYNGLGLTIKELHEIYLKQISHENI